jgi:hypothetical protein
LFGSGLVVSAAVGWLRGTLGNTPARGGVRGSVGAAGGGESEWSVERRGSRGAPGQSQIDRAGSAGV